MISYYKLVVKQINYVDITDHKTEVKAFSHEEPVIHKEYIICADDDIHEKLGTWSYLTIWKINALTEERKKGKTKVIIPTVIGGMAVAEITTYRVMGQFSRALERYFRRNRLNNIPYLIIFK